MSEVTYQDEKFRNEKNWFARRAWLPRLLDNTAYCLRFSKTNLILASFVFILLIFHPGIVMAFGLLVLGIMTVGVTLMWFGTLSVLASNATMGGRQKRRLFPVSKKSKKLGTVQIRELQLPLGYHEAFSVCIDSVKGLRKARVVSMSRDEGTMLIHVPMTLSSFGEIIEFRVIPLEETKTYVMITSKPKVPTTLLDYGKNGRNVERLLMFLEARLRPMLTTQAQAQHQRLLPPPSA